jgi:hypothetical protein
MELSATVRQALETELVALDNKREAIQRILSTDEYKDCKKGPRGTTRATRTPRAGSDISSMDMARTVIRNAGRPLKPQQVSEQIESTYGVLPAKTLFDMLWKRVRAKQSFFKTASGEIGVLEMEPKVQAVRTLQASTK